MELLVAIVGGLAAFVGVYTLTTPARSRELSARLGQFDRAEQAEPEGELAPPFLERVGLPTILALHEFGARMLPSSAVRGLERRLHLAGEPMSVYGFVALQFGVVVVAVLLLSAGVGLGLAPIFVMAVLSVSLLLTSAPLMWLQGAGTKRQGAMLRALPDTVDLIVTMVEAGLSIDAAMWRVSEEMEGALSEELRLTMRETTLGRSRRDALLSLLERTSVPELRTFVHAVLHAQETGVPLGQVLRTQAKEIRLKKRQRAEATAAQAPVKVLVLMLFFIMPSLLLVLLGPAALRMMDLLSST